MTDEPQTFAGEMEIRIAPDAQLVRPVRLAMGGLASLFGFDVETIEDLRIAVNELTATVIDRGDGSDLVVRLGVTPGGVMRIEVRTALGEAADDDRFRLSDQILSVVADDHGFDTADGTAIGWLERRPTEWDDAEGGDGGPGAPDGSTE